MSDEEERERDSASPDECVVGDDDGDEEWSPFDEIQDEFKPGPIPKVTAADGLPTNYAPVNDGDIPALSHRTLVCMGDHSKFVLRGTFGDVIAEFDPEDIERSPFGMWRAPKRLVVERLSMERKRVREYHAKHKNLSELEGLDDEQLTFMLLGQANPGIIVNNAWVQVEPIRPPCRYYARQLTQFELNAGAKAMLRVCSARRTTEGAFMSLRDRAMWACELREPPVAESFDILEESDRKKMEEGAQRKLVPMFATEDDDKGIFGGPNGGE